MDDQEGASRDSARSAPSLATPSATRMDSPPKPRDRAHLEMFHIPVNEACAAWERSLRPGQYFSEKGGRRPMRHRTQAVQGHHPEARTWSRGPDGGAWGPQHLSPIPSERSYTPLVPSPTTSPGRFSRTRVKEGFFPGERSPTATVDVMAAEVGLEEFSLDDLRPFEPIELKQDILPPPPGPPPIEAPWRAPPPGFDLRTLRRQASNLRGEAVEAFRDESSVRESGLRLAETLAATVENGRGNSSAARERLRRLHAALQRLRGERRRDAEAVRAAVVRQDSLEMLREKQASCEERQRRAEQTRDDVQRALDAIVDDNRTTEAEVVRLEDALDEAWRRDEVAAEMERQARNEEIANAFFHRRIHFHSENSSSNDNGRGKWGSSGVAIRDEPKMPSGTCRKSMAIGQGGEGETAAESARVSPLLRQTMSWGFHALVEACRRSKGMRRMATARSARTEEEDRRLLGEALTAWAVAAALERGERVARARRAEEAVRLCFARWQLFAALERRFRVEHRRRVCLRVMETWREATREGRRDLDLERRREALVLRRCFRAWRVFRAKSTLTHQEYFVRRRIADKHRLRGLFGAWHLASLASSSSSAAIVRGFRRRRDAITLAGDFRAWVSLSRARRWIRRRRLRQGLDRLMLLKTNAWSRSRQISSGEGWSRWRLSLLGEEARTTRAREVTRGPGGEASPSGLLVVKGVSDWRLQRLRQRRQQLRGRGLPGAGSGADSIAIAHRRRVTLSNGLRFWFRATALGRIERMLVFCMADREGAGGVGVVVVRNTLLAWRDTATTRRLARIGERSAESSSRRWRLAVGIRCWRLWASVTSRRRRARQAYTLRISFVALRQSCATARRQRSACRALYDILRRQRIAVLGYATRRLSAGPSTATAAEVARVRAGPARRRRDREALGAAWRWWVSGWLRRQAEKIRVRKLEEQRKAKRLRDLGEQLEEAKRTTATLSGEAAAVEKELKNATQLVREQDKALVASRKSLAESAAAATEVKARLGLPVGVTTKGLGSRWLPGEVVDDGSNSSGTAGSHPVKSKAEGGGGVGSKRLARQRPAAVRRRVAEERTVAKEQATANVLGKLRGQEEADRATLEGARAVVQRYRDALEQEQARIDETERERLRVRAATTDLLQRVDELERRAEDEAAQGARGASSAESERAALALEVSTVDARAREIAVILEERKTEAAELRRALAAAEEADGVPPFQKLLDVTESEERSTMVNGDTQGIEVVESSLSRAGRGAFQSSSMATVRSGTDELRPRPRAPSATEAPPSNMKDVQELKKSIALLQQKVASARMRGR